MEESCHPEDSFILELPDEILVSIFSYVPKSNRRLCLPLVCHRWERMVEIKEDYPDGYWRNHMRDCIKNMPQSWLRVTDVLWGEYPTGVAWEYAAKNRFHLVELAVEKKFFSYDSDQLCMEGILKGVIKRNIGKFVWVYEHLEIPHDLLVREFRCLAAKKYKPKGMKMCYDCGDVPIPRIFILSVKTGNIEIAEFFFNKYIKGTEYEAYFGIIGTKFSVEDEEDYGKSIYRRPFQIGDAAMVEWLMTNKFDITNLQINDSLNIRNNPDIYNVLVKHAGKFDGKKKGSFLRSIDKEIQEATDWEEDYPERKTEEEETAEGDTDTLEDSDDGEDNDE